MAEAVQADVVSCDAAGLRTRMFALLALTALGAALGYVGRTAYLAMSDAYIAPMRLSPDSEIVLTSKTKLTQLEIERSRIQTQADVAETELNAIDVKIARLSGARSEAAPGGTRRGSPGGSAVNAILEKLAQEQEVLARMIANQSAIVERARSDTALGLTTRDELEKEQQTLDHLNLARLENERSRALFEHDAQRSQMQSDLELLRLEAERRGKLTERKALWEALAMIDELAKQLRSRPIFQAVEKHLDVAFVPNTQLPGVAPGASIYSCTLAFFACKRVGAVAEVLPGEITMTDPFGKPARGQTAVLALHDDESARATTLRVRRRDVATER